jgi:Domain of unknown function (DUF4272)
VTASEPELSFDEVRPAEDVARRALALCAVSGLGFRAGRQGILQWLSENGLWEVLSPREHGFVDTVEPPQRQIVNAAWKCECLIVCLWALNLIPTIPPADTLCDPDLIAKVMPPFSGISVGDFLRSAVLRREDELLDMQDECLRLHWHARDAKLKDKPPTEPVDIEIIQERHRAINWICGYDGGVEWDEVTTDT